MRIGLGYDIHKLVENRDLILGGVKIPHALGLLGHSDADVLVHAIIDALLGSIALRDIGYHFPDTDERYKGANSITLLKETKKMLLERGYRIINIDSNIICQKPKLLNYIDLIRKNLADALEMPLDDISVKAKTNEKLDSMGQELSISTQAIALVEKLTLKNSF